MIYIMGLDLRQKINLWTEHCNCRLSDTLPAQRLYGSKQKAGNNMEKIAFMSKDALNKVHKLRPVVLGNVCIL